MATARWQNKSTCISISSNSPKSRIKKNKKPNSTFSDLGLPGLRVESRRGDRRWTDRERTRVALREAAPLSPRILGRLGD